MDVNCSQFGTPSSQNGTQSSHLGSSSSHPNTQTPGRSVNKRRSWSPLEEKCLIEAFAEIISQGWKTQNGFRNGFLMQLEQKMKLALPNTDLRGEPHISSKYGSWKKTYRDVAEVLSNSGFNWCAGTKTVEADPPVWDAYELAHPSLKYVRAKSFPFFEVWADIYGRDCANGNGAMDFQGGANVEHPRSANVGEEVNESAAKDDEGAHSEKSASPPGSSSKRRKRSEPPEEVLELISTMWNKATESILEVALNVKDCHERESSCNQQKLYEMIGKLPMVIPMYEQLEAAYEIALCPFAMDLFLSLPDDAKCEMVQRAVQGRLKRTNN